VLIIKNDPGKVTKGLACCFVKFSAPCHPQGDFVLGAVYVQFGQVSTESVAQLPSIEWKDNKLTHGHWLSGETFAIHHSQSLQVRYVDRHMLIHACPHTLYDLAFGPFFVIAWQRAINWTWSLFWRTWERRPWRSSVLRRRYSWLFLASSAQRNTITPYGW